RMGIPIASYLDRVCSIWPEGMTFTPRVRAASRRIVNIERQYFGNTCNVETFTAGLAEWERIVMGEVKAYIEKLEGKEGKSQ
ncbi:MAG: hypothetical protein NTY16_04420, partial [Deltaproteobacteria bacterium]|nr:hypothetical protein [Deltaproteobacteria bacterium]